MAKIKDYPKEFITSKFNIPKGKKLTDDAVLKMSVKDLKGWLEDYYNFRNTTINNKKNEQSKNNQGSKP
jgi:hypothetical protein